MYATPNYAMAERLLKMSYEGEKSALRNNGEPIPDRLLRGPTKKEIMELAQEEADFLNRLRIKSRLSDEQLRRHMTI